jgi:opacity protein-like surface antigen
MKKIVTVLAVFLSFALVAGAAEPSKTEAYLGYSFVRLSSDGNVIPTRDANGGIGQFVWNFAGGLGVAFEAGAVTNSTINLNNIDATVTHFVVGPRYKFLRHDAKWQPFVEALFGGAYSTASTQILATPLVNPLVSVNPLIPVASPAITARLVASRRSFAMLAGGGLDWKLSKHMQVRPFEFDYFQVEPETLFEGPGGRTGSRSNWRYSAGINFTFGAQ